MELQDMSKKEKKRFLSMDLAERMMRIEQSVGASFNKYVPYYQTEYYKSMNSSEQQKFKRFLKNKKKKKFSILLLAVLPVFALFFIQLNSTGEVIDKAIGKGTSFTLDIFIVIVSIIILYVILSYFFMHRRHESRFNKHLNVLKTSMRKNMLCPERTKQ